LAFFRRRREFLLQSGRAAIGFAVPFLLHIQDEQLVNAERRDTQLDGIIEDLKVQVPKLMEEFAVPGLSIAIVRDGTIRWQRGFGVKDRESKQPVVETTMFEAASMSKPVFAYAVMKLCEKGVINLDTPLTKYTPERYLQGDPRIDLITARHVLSHTTGFQNWRSEKENLAIHFTPGERFLYSGEGYSYLESVVARVTGQPIGPYMRAHVFVPFGMTESGYVWSGRFERLMARPHDREGKPSQQKKSSAADVARYGSAGALLSTPTDYAKFLIEVINPKAADAFRLNRASLDEMLRPQIKVQETDEYSIWWGLGWRIAKTKDGELISHGGDNQGFHCDAEGRRDTKSAFVIMTNSDGGTALIAKLAPELACRVHTRP
jgi:CubicO group peptidase (beta-lactamase class C family)